ncbi:GL19346 [Drosophila persimilis]|uniref:GL18774 n=1 Tax=Drosophila persimilis TaxID=7234 RepID=B4G8S9_DROPE|nr:GL18774 [Drosophila persimilis]EDW28760.1 GL19346 [Drosophila persimilis]
MSMASSKTASGCHNPARNISLGTPERTRSFGGITRGVGTVGRKEEDHGNGWTQRSHRPKTTALRAESCPERSIVASWHRGPACRIRREVRDVSRSGAWSGQPSSSAHSLK